MKLKTRENVENLTRDTITKAVYVTNLLEACDLGFFDHTHVPFIRLVFGLPPFYTLGRD